MTIPEANQLIEESSISVVIPLYNKSYSIERCLFSVLSQSIRPSEIIVVNDGSTDDGEEKALAYMRGKFDKFRLLSIENSGVSFARNLGVENSSSEYIAFLDADDEWLSCHIERRLIAIRDYPLSEVYSGAHFDVSERKMKSGAYSRPSPIKEREVKYINCFFNNSKKYSLLNSSKVVIRKKALMAVGGFPVGISTGEDLHLWILLGSRCRIVFDGTRSSIVHHQVDESRGGRLGDIPYPLIYYSVNPPLPIIKPYLKSILVKHYFGYLAFENTDQAKKILFESKNIFPFYVFFLSVFLFSPKSFFKFLRMIKNT